MKKSDQLILVLLVGGVFLFMFWIMSGGENRFAPGGVSPDVFGLKPGEKAPVIRAAGWINGNPPTEDEMRGKVVVLDAWAYWCGPCLRAAPELVDIHNKMQGKDVIFLGLTSEGEDVLEKSEAFVKEAGFTWPNGYGAFGTIQELRNQVIPAAWVIGRDGVIVWYSGMEGQESLEEAIERALAATETSQKPAEIPAETEPSSETPQGGQ